MMGKVASSVTSVFVMTFASRLLPGATTILAARLAALGRNNRAVVLLTVVSAVDLICYWALCLGPGSAVVSRLAAASGPRWRGVALLLLGAILLAHRVLEASREVPSASSRLQILEQGQPLIADMAVALIYSGRWAWWATFGVAICGAANAAGPRGAAANFAAFVAGLACLYWLILAAARRGASLLGPKARARAETTVAIVLVVLGCLHLLLG